MPCPDKKPVRSYLTDKEYDQIVQMARRAGLSISQFIRRVCLGHEVRSFEHEEFRLELLKTRADLGRMGGLLKAALAVGAEHFDIAPDELRKLLSEITICMRSLKSVVERL